MTDAITLGISGLSIGVQKGPPLSSSMTAMRGAPFALVVA